MKFITKRMICVLNSLVINHSGGLGGIWGNVRAGQSLGFVERIHQNSVFGTALYDDIFERAAAYMFYIIKNHTFNDGNKRTGLVTAVTFLEWNNIRFREFPEDETYEFVMSIAGEGEQSEQALKKIAVWLRERVDSAYDFNATSGSIT